MIMKLILKMMIHKLKMKKQDLISKNTVSHESNFESNIKNHSTIYDQVI